MLRHRSPIIYFTLVQKRSICLGRPCIFGYFHKCSYFTVMKTLMDKLSLFKVMKWAIVINYLILHLLNITIYSIKALPSEMKKSCDEARKSELADYARKESEPSQQCQRSRPVLLLSKVRQIVLEQCGSFLQKKRKKITRRKRSKYSKSPHSIYNGQIFPLVIFLPFK